MSTKHGSTTNVTNMESKEKVSINVDVEQTPEKNDDAGGENNDNDGASQTSAGANIGAAAAAAQNVDSLHPLRDSEPNSAASSTAASRRSTYADIESDEGEAMHFSVDREGRRKSRNLREAVAHLKEEAIRR